MNLDQVSIEIRPRPAWEAVDLGLLMARRWWWQVLDSNQRRLSRRFYRPLPLAARATCLGVVHHRVTRFGATSRVQRGWAEDENGI